MGQHDWGALAEVAIIGGLLVLGMKAIVSGLAPPKRGTPAFGPDPFGLRSGAGNQALNAYGAQQTGLLTYGSNLYAGDVAM